MDFILQILVNSIWKHCLPRKDAHIYMPLIPGEIILLTLSLTMAGNGKLKEFLFSYSER